jgi:hypothetical protein
MSDDLTRTGFNDSLRRVSAVEVLIVVVILLILGTITVFALSGISNPNHDHEQECLARGGTILLDAENRYDGCMIGGRAG